MTEEERLAKKKEAEEAALKAAEDKKAPDDKKTDDKEGGDKTVQWTQAEVEEFGNKMYKKGATNSKDAKKRDAEQVELEELRKFKEDTAKKASDTKTGDDATDADKAWQAKLDTMNEEFSGKLEEVTGKLTEAEAGRTADQQAHYGKDLEAQVLTAAAAAGAHDPEDVFLLMERKGYFSRDEESGNWQMMNPDTERIRIDVEEQGNPLSIKKGVAEYVNSRPSYKRPSGRQGSGTDSGSGGPDREIPKADGFDPDNMKASDVFKNRKELVKHVQAGGQVSVGGRHNQG